MTIPLVTEDENPNPDEVHDDGLGAPPTPEPVSDIDVDEDYSPDTDDGSDIHEED